MDELKNDFSQQSEECPEEQANDHNVKGCSSSMVLEILEEHTKRSCDIIDSMSDNNTPMKHKPHNGEAENVLSPDQGYCPSSPERPRIGWVVDVLDGSPIKMPEKAFEEESGPSANAGKTCTMPVPIDSLCYNMSHANRGKCVIFNHDIFDIGFEERKGSILDAKRIEVTFGKLGFEVEILDNLAHSDVMSKVQDLSKMDHTDDDCICIFVLTHGIQHDMISAKDVVYKADTIWKPFTADRCSTLAGKPKLFFFQACRGNKLDEGVVLQARSSETTQTDSITTSYKIPTHADFLLAHSTAKDFYSWRNTEKGTWYIQSLCDVVDEYSATTDLLKMLTITARKVSTEYQSYNDLDVTKSEQKQVPCLTSMLIRDLHFTPKY